MLSDESQKRELNASNLAAHNDRMQLDRLASAGMVSSSPSSTISRSSSSAAAARRALEEAETVKLDQAETI
jgi:hypothetical protein